MLLPLLLQRPRNVFALELLDTQKDLPGFPTPEGLSTLNLEPRT
jgi:hypothetical protein